MSVVFSLLAFYHVICVAMVILKAFGAVEDAYSCL